jgi:leader peptidase (prepilin peptidase) / N-methyltransferase
VSDAITPLVALAAALGAVWGVAADRIATRWPAHLHEHVHDHAAGDPEHEHPHEPGDEPVEGRAWAHEHPHRHRPDLAHGWVVPRPLGWRTGVVAVTGALALGGVALRFDDPVSTLAFGAYAIALVLLLATDLDQRRMPDLITLPAIPLALVFSLLGANPLVPPGVLPIALVVALAVPALLFAFSIPFGSGAFGLGDVKLLVSAGLLAGPLRMFSGVVYGLLFTAIVVVALLVLRRITLKTYIPFGPFLILGALWAILAVR